MVETDTVLSYWPDLEYNKPRITIWTVSKNKVFEMTKTESFKDKLDLSQIQNLRGLKLARTLYVLSMARFSFAWRSRSDTISWIFVFWHWRTLIQALYDDILLCKCSSYRKEMPDITFLILIIFGKFDEINCLSSFGWPGHYFLQLKLEILQNSTFVNIDSGMIGLELIGTRFVQKKNLF